MIERDAPQERSARPEVRNPLLALPAAARLQEMPPEALAWIAEVFGQLSAQANERAEQAWAKKKAPMAAYYKAVSVWAKHAVRLARRAGVDRRKTAR